MRSGWFGVKLGRRLAKKLMRFECVRDVFGMFSGCFRDLGVARICGPENWNLTGTPHRANPRTEMRWEDDARQLRRAAQVSHDCTTL
jgi:hypothetical protein